MSPSIGILSLIVLVVVPALIYALSFFFPCPGLQRPSRGALDSSPGNEDEKQDENVSCEAIKYMEADTKEEYGVECPVCLSAFAEGDLVRLLNACKHSFHVECIDKWLATHSNCPVCRADVPIPAVTARPKRPARRIDDDFRQGLPDAADLV